MTLNGNSNEKREIDPFLVKKWEHAFYTFFDLNRNGTIEWTDFEALIDVIGHVRGKRNDEYLTAKLCLTEVWSSMTDELEMDHNDKISLSDWINMWRESLNQSKPAEWQLAYVDYIFRLLDASGDKLVDQAEYVQILGYFSIPRPTAIECFDKFAVNFRGDPLNAIDFKQFSKLWSGYFRSVDRKEIGNYLLGYIVPAE